MRFNSLSAGVCCAAIFFVSCEVRTVELTNGNSTVNRSTPVPSATGANANRVRPDQELYYLDPNNLTIQQSIDGNREADGAKFVEVEVVEVINPKKYPLTFRVYYQPKSAEKLYLGSFSLFPADHPGHFIVATQGKVKSEGSIIVSVESREKIEPQSGLKIAVRKIGFRKE